MENTRTLSPSSSPRLPSPPPIPEVQIGLKSPTINALPNSTLPGPPTLGKISPELADLSNPDNGVTRRIRPGTKAADMASGPPLVPLSEVESSFQLQEHVKALYYHHTKSDKTNTTMALNHQTALLIATPPEGVDRPLWLYELCRLLVIEVNALVIAFFSENPPCSAATCPEMRASEWQYLCAVHDPPKSCCAIDYCCHTLDWASNVLTSQKNFPSRLTLGSENTGGSQQGMRHLTNIFRRVYRIFAHAWFQHRASFWEVEGKKGLYIFFKTVCDAYTLIPDENYTISSEAEGITTSVEKEREKEGRTILKRVEDAEIRNDDIDPKTVTTLSAGATTRRRGHTPSTGSAVTTIAEGDEDDSHAPPSPSENDAPVAKIEIPAPSLPSKPPPPPRPTSTATAETAEVPANRNEDFDITHRTESDLPSIKDPDIPKIIETPVEESLQGQTSESREQKKPKAESSKEEVLKEEVLKEEVPKEEAPKEEAPKEEAPKEEAPKEAAPKEAAPKEAAPKEAAPKEAETREVETREVETREVETKEKSSEEENPKREEKAIESKTPKLPTEEPQLELEST